MQLFDVSRPFPSLTIDVEAEPSNTLWLSDAHPELECFIRVGRSVRSFASAGVAIGQCVGSNVQSI
jgi:hypothetical protein